MQNNNEKDNEKVIINKIIHRGDDIILEIRPMTDEEKAKMNKEINDQRNKKENKIDRVYSIKNDKLRFIRYYCMYSLETGKPFPHPMKIWEERGKEHIIEAIPTMFAGCWFLLVKDWEESLEEYEDEINLSSHDPYWEKFGIDIIE